MLVETWTRGALVLAALACSVTGDVSSGQYHPPEGTTGQNGGNVAINATVAGPEHRQPTRFRRRLLGRRPDEWYKAQAAAAAATAAPLSKTDMFLSKFSAAATAAAPPRAPPASAAATASPPVKAGDPDYGSFELAPLERAPVCPDPGICGIPGRAADDAGLPRMRGGAN